ncbi:hypothetical protein H0H81_011930 [Sphagnurus paluster]|uniref:J domain-containing protein n=1 Tax=Sphagnurus paluster TaxID=117069 RepID=A0A9P7GJN1_9AGAR|nr:hypothetical protein H0H81_011930 [Sphagnurus paluster]
MPTTQPTYRKQYAVTFAVVVLTYLLYNLIESARSMPPNFYQILSVHPTVDEQGLKAAFRQFAKRHHPDRPGVGREGQELFIMVRDVYEALKDPVVRFAYDRFGPDVLTWSQKCTTTRDYIQQGLLQSSGYHIVVGAALLFWSLIGSSSSANPVSFWRYTLYATLFVAEISLIISPSPSPVTVSSPALAGLRTTYTTHTLLHTLFPERLIHQHVLFLHQLFIFLSIALSRVAPVLLSAFFPETQPTPPAVNAELAQLTAIADRETSVMLHTLLHSISSPESAASPHEDISSLARPRPFRPPEGIFAFPDPRTTPPEAHPERDEEPAHPLTRLRREMEELIIEANIKKEDGPLRSVWEAAVRRGRAGLGLESRRRAASPENDEQGGLGGVETPRRNFWEAPAEVEHVQGDDDGEINVEASREFYTTLTAQTASPRRNDGVRVSH